MTAIDVLKTRENLAAGAEEEHKKLIFRYQLYYSYTIVFLNRDNRYQKPTPPLNDDILYDFI